MKNNTLIFCFESTINEIINPRHTFMADIFGAGVGGLALAVLDQADLTPGAGVGVAGMRHFLASVTVGGLI